MAVYDRNYARGEFREHGEEWLQEKLKGKLEVVFDVGSNIGEWTTMTREYQPDATIHTFEVVYETYRRFLTNITHDDKIVPNGFGLSNECGVLPMKWRKDYDAVSTHLANLAVENFEWRDGLVFTGDMYRKSRCVDYIDFLKVDTEGAEGKVFEGFKETLQEQRIGIIQFEYGYAAILSKWLLVDAYELLRPL
jgi:FkbM family methyltransferase